MPVIDEELDAPDAEPVRKAVDCLDGMCGAPDCSRCGDEDLPDRVREYVSNMTPDELRIWVRDDLLSWPDDEIKEHLEG